MAEIPEDIKKVATEAAAEGSWNGVANKPWVDIIARAILTERQRCADLTEKYRERPIGSEARLVASYIQREINHP